jgi:hypothetical protein
MSILLEDKTTNRSIIWATNSYEKFGDWYDKGKQITVDALMGLSQVVLQPRVLKSLKQQRERTKSHAEVFTPAWLCNMMNNHFDEEWFGRKDVFNVQHGRSWTATAEKIVFPKGKCWKHYVDATYLEVTCGEAPYLVSRYDMATGKIIPITDRIGILDRKLRVVGENTNVEQDWLKWTYRAIQSVYGYEYQGDNLLIGRINLLMTFVDYISNRWGREPTVNELKKVADIISWNLWQMNGLTGVIPLSDSKQKCKIYDWRANSSVFFSLTPLV